MAQVFGAKYTHEELLQFVGDLNQFAGVRVGELGDGYERGVRTAEFRTGSGFEFTVLVDRGLDIGWASYNGASLAWRSSTPIVGPAYYEPEGAGWLRGFLGGLVTTCGLTYYGAASADQGVPLGLHGRASNIPADKFCYGGGWIGDEYEMWVTGELREAAVFGDYLVLRRRISARLGESRVKIEDTVTNEGHRTSPQMLLYHCNLGFPIVSPESEWISSSLEVRPRDAAAVPGMEGESYRRFETPTREYREQVFYHTPKPDADGYAGSALANNRLGLGVYMRFKVSELPVLVEWKQMGQTEYVVGMEPGTNRVQGRGKEREDGLLRFLEPGESRHYGLEIGVLRSRGEIESFRRSLPG